MKKILKNKKGFTLIEMVLVIAIIVILSTVMFLSVSTYLAKANTARSTVSAHNLSLTSILDGIS